MELANLTVLIEKAMATLATTTTTHTPKSKPDTYKESLRRADRPTYYQAELKHLKKIIDIGVIKMTLRSEAAVIMKGRWVYALKERAHSDGQLEASARYVPMGFTQQHGVDYDETTSPTMAMASYKALEAIAAQCRLVIRECWDITGAYYRAFPKYRQFVEQPPGHARSLDHQAAYNWVWELLRCMPGTKDPGHHFNAQFTQHLLGIGFKILAGDPASFMLRVGGKWMAITLHVDDMAVFATSQDLMDAVYKSINHKYPTKRVKGINLIMGIKVDTTPTSTSFSQSLLIEDVAERMGLVNSKAPATP